MLICIGFILVPHRGSRPTEHEMRGLQSFFVLLNLHFYFFLEVAQLPGVQFSEAPADAGRSRRGAVHGPSADRSLPAPAGIGRELPQGEECNLARAICCPNRCEGFFRQVKDMAHLQTFLVYILNHNQPAHEVLQP